MTDNLLKFSANLGHDQLMAGQTRSELSCHVKIEPNLLVGEESNLATATHICLLFDCSFSMSGRKFETAIRTAKMIVDILHERHCLSLVAFHSGSDVVFNNAVPTNNEKESIKKEIDKISDQLGGSTNLAAGIYTGMKVLSESVADADIIVILSDGKADSAEKALSAAEKASLKGIQIFAVGIGEFYDAEQLLHLVTPSNGTVFGDTEGDQISSIFHDIINRIDRILASRVKLNFTFDERVQLKRLFKTSPERASFDSLKIDSNHNLEIQVGNVENNKIYEFLLQLEVGQHDVGVLQLAKVILQYDINHLGIKKQESREIILTVKYTENETLEYATNETISSAMKRASVVQLCDDIVQACSQPDTVRALHAIDQLEQKCKEENNTSLQQRLESIKTKLESGQKISDKERNDFLLACTKGEAEVTPEIEAPPEAEVPPEVEVLPVVKSPPVIDTLPDAELYNFVLVEPGSEIFRVLREIRDTTHMGIAEIAAIIKSRNSLVTTFKNKSDAKELQQRLAKIGAKVEIQISGGTGENS